MWSKRGGAGSEESDMDLSKIPGSANSGERPSTPQPPPNTPSAAPLNAAAPRPVQPVLEEGQPSASPGRDVLPIASSRTRSAEGTWIEGPEALLYAGMGLIFCYF